MDRTGRKAVLLAIAVCAFLPATASAVPVGGLLARGCIIQTGTDCGAGNTFGGLVSRDVAVSPDGKNVYSVGQANPNNTITTFNRNADGSLTTAGCYQDDPGISGNFACASSAHGLNGAEDVAVSPDGKSVYVASTSGDIVTFVRDTTTGALSSPSCLKDHFGTADCGASPEVDGLEGATAVAVSSDDKNVYVVSFLDNAVVTFNRDTSGGATHGALTAAGCFDNPGGDVVCGANTATGMNQAEGVAVSPDGKSVYVTAESSDTIVTFTRNTTAGPTLGALSAPSCIQDTGGNTCGAGNNAPGLDGAQAVVVSPNNQNVYVASAGSWAVTTLTRNTGSGALSGGTCFQHSQKSGCGAGNTAPGLAGANDIDISPDGASVYVSGAELFGQDRDAVVAFTRNASTGALTPAGCLENAGGNPLECSGNTTTPLGPVGVAVSPVVNNANVFDVYVASGFAVHWPQRQVAPACSDTSASVDFGTSKVLTLPCSDPNGDHVMASAVTSPAHGTLSGFTGLAVTYTPAAGYSGPDTFTYKGSNPAKGAGDASVDSGTQTVTITVGAPPPDADGDGVPDSSDVCPTVAAATPTGCPATGGGGGGGAGTGGTGTPTSGNDKITRGAGNDTVKSGAGNDTVDAGAGNDVVDGGTGNDRLLGGLGNDFLLGGLGNDSLFGGSGNDRLGGGAGKDLLDGGLGNDALDGGAGNDTLKGGAGTNSYKGGLGNDNISAKNGKKETVDCGAGKDTASADRKDVKKGCETVR